MKVGLKAWVGQRRKDIVARGKAKAPWLVFWNEPGGRRREKSCGPGKEGWRLAQKEKQRLHGLLISDAYETNGGRTWQEFREEYDTKALPRLANAVGAGEHLEIRLHGIETGGYESRPAPPVLVSDLHDTQTACSGGLQGGVVTECRHLNAEPPQGVEQHGLPRNLDRSPVHVDSDRVAHRATPHVS